MKKICVVTPLFLPVPAVEGGGVETLINILIDQNEVKKKYNFTIYTIPSKKIENKYKYSNIVQVKLNYFTFTFKRVINKVFNILKIDKYYSFNKVLYKKIARMVKKENCDFILIENNMDLYKVVYKYNKDKKFIYHLHNDLNNIDKTPSNYKFINETAYKILVISNYLKNKLISVQKSNKICLLSNVIDKEKYTLHKKDEATIKKLKNKYNIKNIDKVIGYIGRPDEEKGLLELIEAFNKLKNNDLKLLCVCDDFMNAKYKKGYSLKLFDLVSKSKNIIVTGRVPYSNIIDYYDLIDILVIPTICEEAFGLVALEGKALNKQIIYTNSGALPEILDNKNYKMVSRDGDIVDNLYKALKDEVNNKEVIKNDFVIESYEDYFNNFCNLIN